MQEAVACQMMPAVFDQTVIEIDAGRVGLRATGQVMRFAGYLAIYAEAQDEGSPVWPRRLVSASLQQGRG